MYWLSPTEVTRVWPITCRIFYFFIAAIHLFMVDVSSSNTHFLTVLHTVVFPGRPQRFPLFVIWGYTPTSIYFIISSIVQGLFIVLSWHELQIDNLRHLFISKENIQKKRELAIKDYVLWKDFILFNLNILIGSLYCWSVFLVVFGWLGEIEVTLGTLIAIFLTPLLIAIILSMRITSLHHSINNIGLGVIITACIISLIIVDQSYPNYKIIHHIMKTRKTSTPGLLAQRRMMISRRLELSVSSLYCRRDHFLCKAQKALLGIRDTDTELYVNPPLDDTNPKPRPVRSAYQWWSDFSDIKLSNEEIQDPSEILQVVEQDDLISPSFPLKDNAFMLFNRKEYLYHPTAQRKVKEFVQMPEDQYKRVLDYYTKSRKKIRNAMENQSKNEKEKYLEFEDEELLKCDASDGSCTFDKSRSDLLHRRLVEPDVFTYKDPYTKNVDDIRYMSKIHYDIVGFPRQFLLDCDVQFEHYRKEISMSAICLEGRGRGKEFEFLQVMKTHGLPTWRFRRLGLTFAGILTVEEIESILRLNGNETHELITITE